jgi:phage protein Gp37/Gp68
MGAKTGIEWTEATWNPVVGCTMVSPGCAHCYAETMAARLKAMALADIAAGKDPGRKRHYIEAGWPGVAGVSRAGGAGMLNVMNHARMGRGLKKAEIDALPKRTKVVFIRLTEGQYRQVREAAGRHGACINAFCTAALEAAVTETMQEAKTDADSHPAGL